MGGLKGQSRVPNTTDPRQRRNSSNLASEVSWISPSEVVSLNGDGELTLTLATNGGLANASGSLTVVANAPVELSSAGVGLTAAFQQKVEQAGNTLIPGGLAVLTQVASEEAAEEAIVAAATLSWTGF